MSLAPLVELVQTPGLAQFDKQARAAFDALFGGDGGRYPAVARSAVALRVNAVDGDTNVPYMALIDTVNPPRTPDTSNSSRSP